MTLGSAILLYLNLTAPRMSPDFPQVITDRLENREDVYLPEIDANVRSFCVVGSYENVKASLHEHGLKSDIDFYVNEGDAVLVLVGPNDELRYREYSYWKFDATLEARACYPAIHNRLVFKRNANSEKRYLLTVERVAEITSP